MVLKEVVKQRNEIAYRIIQNSYNNAKITHNYLISSSQIVNSDYFLYFLAQVVICNEGFACGTCNNCTRILKNQYSDLHVLDGSIDSIKKEEILNVQYQMGQTSLEAKNVKILLIKNIDNTSVQGVNSLLKLIEEPPNNTYILISTNKVNNVLSTIKSRAQHIRLNILSRDTLIEELMNKKIPEDDAYILSIISSSSTKSYAFFNGDYLKHKNYIIDFFQKWVVNINDAQIHILSIDYKKIDLKIFLRLFLVFLNDIWRESEDKGISFKNNITLLNSLNKKHFPVYKCIELTNELLLFIDSNQNIQLQIYAWIIKMFGEKNDR